MKRTVSVILTLALVMGLLSGLAVSASAEPIEAVELRGVTAPVAGQAPCTVQVPEDANYTLEADWFVYDYEDEYFIFFDGVFENGNIYELQMAVIPNEGYELSPETCPVMLVDGQPYETLGW